MSALRLWLAALLWGAVLAVLPAASLPERVDLDVDEDPLVELLEQVARQCDAGLVVLDGLEADVQQSVTIDVDDAAWGDLVAWLLDEYGLALILRDGRLEVRDASRLARAELVVAGYDVAVLTAGIDSHPGPRLELPEPGGFGAMLVPAIMDEEPPELGDVLEILAERLPEALWDIDGAGLDELNGQLVVVLQPEGQAAVRSILDEMERIAARQVVVRSWRLPADTAVPGPVVDAGAWTALRPTASPLGVHVQADESRMHHFSGIQQAYLADVDVVGEAFDPIATVRSRGMVVDTEVHATLAGVLTTLRVQRTSDGGSSAAAVQLGATEVARIERPAIGLLDVSDTRLIPDGGAALLPAADALFAVSVEVLDYREAELEERVDQAGVASPAPAVGE